MQQRNRILIPLNLKYVEVWAKYSPNMVKYFILYVWMIRIEGSGQKWLGLVNGPNNLFHRNWKAALMSHFQNSQNTMLRISKRYRFSSRHPYIGGHFLFQAVFLVFTIPHHIKYSKAKLDANIQMNWNSDKNPGDLLKPAIKMFLWELRRMYSFMVRNYLCFLFLGASL